jgi:phosphoribosylanthranilate isomerase
LKTKICGVCRADDASRIHVAGADYIGVILAKKGARQQSVEAAKQVFAAAGDLLRVGVFADQSVDDVCDAVIVLDLDVVQLHGSEDTQLINEIESSVDVAIWKSVSLQHAGDLERAIDEYADHVDGLLLDAKSGGSGHTFDWSLAANARAWLPQNVELIVAGGLTPENVKEVVAYLKPDIVDVASGVERNVCEKEADLIQAFIRNAKS